MSGFAKTPTPPYYAVIFTSALAKTELVKDELVKDELGYEVMAEKMVNLAQLQPGFLGIESARENVGITVSYWADLESISAWKAHLSHQEAQELGRRQWYENFTVRVSKVEREYSL